MVPIGIDRAKQLKPLREGENPWPFNTDNAYAEKDNWKDFAAHAKEKLVGKTAQIVRPVMDEERNQYKFVPVKDISDISACVNDGNLA